MSTMRWAEQRPQQPLARSPYGLGGRHLRPTGSEPDSYSGAQTLPTGAEANDWLPTISASPFAFAMLNTAPTSN